jgi:prepilin signal peptidase PulO-like enzyme (type II secretory pathway)
MNIILITILFLIIAGIAFSYLVNYFADALPLTVDDIPHKLSFHPVCTHCNENKTWGEFLLFRPCHSCSQSVPLRNWIVLIIMPICFVMGYLFPPHQIQGWMLLLLIVYFMIVAVIDITHRIVLRSLTIIGWILSLGIGYLIHGLPLALLGGASSLILMLLLFYAGVLFSKMMAKRRGEPVDEALGFGDVYISIMAGFLIAFPDIFSALILAILLGGVISLGFLVNMLARKDYKPLTPIPYAPFIILATFILMYKQGM